MISIRKGLSSFQSLKPVPLASRVITRGKRTMRKGLQPGAQRLVTMLSVFSARKKQPRRLKLSLEDSIRHKTVQSAWRIHMREKRISREEQLQQQYQLMDEAAAELENTDEWLYKRANERQFSKRFSPELRVPTETPPNEPWQHGWKKEEADAKANSKK